MQLTSKDGGLEKLHELVDLNEHVDRHFQLGTFENNRLVWEPRDRGQVIHVQNLEKVVGLLVSLGEQTQRECGDRVMAPRSEKGNEEHLTLLD